MSLFKLSFCKMLYCKTSLFKLSVCVTSNPLMYSLSNGEREAQDEHKRKAKIVVRLEFILILGQVRLGQVRICQVMKGQVKKGYVRLRQDRIGQVRLGKVRLGQARLGQARLGQARLVSHFLFCWQKYFPELYFKIFLLFNSMYNVGQVRLGYVRLGYESLG